MRIKQIFNNSVVSAVSEDGEEVIVMGRGLGFDKKAGDPVPTQRIEKIFRMSPKSNDKFKQLLEDVSFEHLHVSDEIISQAKEMIGKRLNENVYITLTDHISYAVERYRQGVILKNAMLFEIQSFYSQEYAAGRRAIEIIKDRLGVELEEDEAGFIALHFVNAELDTSMEHMQDLTSLIRNVLNLVRLQLQISYDETSLDYSRFVIHLRYLGQRVFMNKELRQDDPALGEVVRKNYPRAYHCAEKIAVYIEKQYHVTISEDDKIFLAVHIHRLVKASLLKS